MSFNYSEDQFQEAAAEYFHTYLGWESVFTGDEETFGKNGTLGRADRTEVLLERDLREALERLNPGHPESAYQDAINQLKATDASQELEQINEAKYKLIRDGIRVSYRTVHDEKREPLLRVIDFDDPQSDNNRFRVVRELWIQGRYHSRRPDILGFVNGIPLLFIELKRQDKDPEIAYQTNYTDYKDTIPHLFYYNALVMLSNGHEAKVGTITSPYKFFHDWTRLTEDDEREVEFKKMQRCMCNKRDFIDIVQNYLFFDTSSGKMAKILARNHQFLGVNHAFEAVQERKAKQGKLGVFWHTQGSGKSYSMAFLSEKVHRQLPGSFTFLIVTDREDLDDQIVQTFAGVGAIQNNRTQASDGKHLIELLKANHRYVFTIINKFNKLGKIYSERDNIIVLCDEAHRTQYGVLAENMRYGLRNASFIAFTATPLMDSEEDQQTREKFGGYISTYDTQQAIEDGATVPLYYDNRTVELKYVREEDGQEVTIAAPATISEQIADEVEKHGLTDQEEALVMRRLGRDYAVLTSTNRLDRIAQDIVQHYTQRWQLGKAMVVCLDRFTAVRMYDLIDRYWQEEIEKQRKAIKQERIDQTEAEQKQRLKWLEETERCVVISGGSTQNEIKAFDDQGLDIRLHRKKMVDRKLDDDFKKPEHPFRLAIVCAMWLTGFDVPSLGTLYMDKPLKGHNLMQAIARANRVDEGKNNGLLVDYNGILASLQKALIKYTTGKYTGDRSDDRQKVKPPFGDLEELGEKYAESIAACAGKLHELGFDLQLLIDARGYDRLELIADAVDAIRDDELAQAKQEEEEVADFAIDAICITDSTQSEFNVLAEDVLIKQKALGRHSKSTKPYRQQFEAIEAIYKRLNLKMAARDLGTVMKSMYDLVNESIEASLPATTSTTAVSGSNRLYDISRIRWDLIGEKFRQSNTKNSDVQVIRKAIDRELRRAVKRNPRRLDLYKRYEEIVSQQNQLGQQVTIEQVFTQLQALGQELEAELSRADREGLSEEELAIFDLLWEGKEEAGLDAVVRDRVKFVSRQLIATVKGELNSLGNWRKKDTAQGKVKALIYDFLFSEESGLPLDGYEDDEIKPLSDEVFLHVFERYTDGDRTAYTRIEF